MDDKKRCQWCTGSEMYMKYHDEEWGVPVHDENLHFEFLVLEGAQAGLSWATILKRRDGYRRVYGGFDPEKVSRFSENKISSMLEDTGIIRNRMKVNSSINNAKRFIEVQKGFGSFDAYIWSFVDGKQIVNKWKTLKQIPATSELSDRVSKDMKKRGFSFVGSTIIYAHLQATGIVNDHMVDCFRWKEVQRQAFIYNATRIQLCGLVV